MIENRYRYQTRGLHVFSRPAFLLGKLRLEEAKLLRVRKDAV